MIAAVPAGLVLPESVLGTSWFSVLAVFVAINTVMYLALAVSKVMPKLYPRDWLPRSYARGRTRSIHPDAER